MSDRFGIIFCGGFGTRLWPLSRNQEPKQLLPLNGSKTLLEQTADRLVGHVSLENLFVVTNENHCFEVMEQPAELFSGNVSNILSELYPKKYLTYYSMGGVGEIRQKTPELIMCTK